MSAALRRHQRPVLAASVVACLTVGLFLAPGLLGSARRPAITQTADTSLINQPLPAPQPKKESITPTPSAMAIKQAGVVGTTHTCLQHVVADAGCLEHRGAGATVLIVGDSHLETFLPVFDRLAVQHNITLYSWVILLCPWQKGVLPVNLPGQSGDPGGSCRHGQGQLYNELLPKIRPDVTIVMTRGYDDPNYPRPLFQDGAFFDGTDPGTVLTQSIPSAVGSVLVDSKRLIVVEPWPSLPNSQRACLSASRYDEQCVEYAGAKLPDEKAVEDIARTNHRVATVDLDSAVCPRLPACDAVLDGTIVRRDQDHLSIPFAATLASALDRRLQSVGAYQRP